MIRFLILALVLGFTAVLGTGSDYKVAEKTGLLASRAVAEIDGKAVVAWIHREIPWDQIEDTAKALGKELARFAETSSRHRSSGRR